MKKIFASFFVFTLCFSAASTSFASTNIPIDDGEDTKVDKIPISLEIQSQLLTESLKESDPTVTITDELELERIAKERGLEKIPTKIEYEYNPEKTGFKKLEDTVSPYASGKICYVKNLGPGHYSKNNDLYKRFVIDGPDTFKIQQTIKKTSSYSGSFGVSKSVIEASVGFKIGVESSVSFTSNTPIKSNQRAIFNLYTTHQKVRYAVDTGKTCAIGNAYKPNGTFIEKIFNKK